MQLLRLVRGFLLEVPWTASFWGLLFAGTKSISLRIESKPWQVIDRLGKGKAMRWGQRLSGKESMRNQCTKQPDRKRRIWREEEKVVQVNVTFPGICVHSLLPLFWTTVLYIINRWSTFSVSVPHQVLSSPSFYDASSTPDFWAKIWHSMRELEWANIGQPECVCVLCDVKCMMTQGSVNWNVQLNMRANKRQWHEWVPNIQFKILFHSLFTDWHPVYGVCDSKIPLSVPWCLWLLSSLVEETERASIHQLNGSYFMCRFTYCVLHSPSKSNSLYVTAQ